MTDPLIKKFQKEALSNLVKEFKPEKVIFFGSRVKGNAKSNSDIDIIIISSYFKDVPFLKRMPLVLKKVSFPKHVDYMCYTREEYDRIKNESSIIMDALENSLEYSISM
ncbi:MAG: nucleotidyltransferase domain-containing protein [Candidatus Poribacteria bacterium]